MISEKDYDEIYLKGYEDGKNDKNNLEIHYEIKPSFTTRKIKELQQENKQLKDNWNKLKEYLHNVDVVVDYSENYDGHFINYDELIDKMQELEQGSDK